MTDPQTVVDTAEADFGARVAERRKKLRWSQRELGERLGLDASGVSRLEAGRRMVRLGEAQQIAEVLDVPLETLVRPTAPTARLTAAVAAADAAVSVARTALMEAVMAVTEAAQIATDADTPADVVASKLGADPADARIALLERVRQAAAMTRAIVPSADMTWVQQVADLLAADIAHPKEK